MYNWKLQLIFVCLLAAFFPLASRANLLPDFDQDGVPDIDEQTIYFTDYRSADTDGDGYSDWIELNSGYSPHDARPIKLVDSDFDRDGLTDAREFKFATDPTNSDSDGDGFSDGEEVAGGFDPNSPGKKLEKRIEISTASQRLEYFLGEVRLASYLVSSGARNSTPKGNFTIANKHPKAWSSAYGLWMPYWLGLSGTRAGIHELPVWPNGYVEGEDHLGTPVSHGCIRLGKGPAETLYNWAEVGTKVFVY